MLFAAVFEKNHATESHVIKFFTYIGSICDSILYQKMVLLQKFQYSIINLHVRF